MKTSEFIKLLQELVDKHGDLTFKLYADDLGYSSPDKPELVRHKESRDFGLPIYPLQEDSIVI